MSYVLIYLFGVFVFVPCLCSLSILQIKRLHFYFYFAIHKLYLPIGPLNSALGITNNSRLTATCIFVYDTCTVYLLFLSVLMLVVTSAGPYPDQNPRRGHYFVQARV